jgi:hypothetical protein
VLDLGDVSVGQDQRVTVELTNWSDRPVRIFGGSTDCSCDVTEDLPLAIPAGETKNLTIIVKLPTAQGFFTRKALLRTDCDGARDLVIQVSGRIVEKQTEERQEPGR